MKPKKRRFRTPTVDEVKAAVEAIRTRPTVDLWPEAANALGVSRSAIYAAARTGRVDVLELDGRRKKAISASLRKQLGLDAAI
jgi:hypothetical protein